MQSKLAPDEIYTGFDLIALNQVPYENFCNQMFLKSLF